MLNAVTVTEPVDNAGGTVQVDAPADHCIVDWYSQFASADPTQWATTELVVDGDGLITGAVFSPSASDYDATIVCVPIELPDPPVVPDLPATNVATLVAGVATVSHAALTANSHIFLQRKSAGGTVAGNTYEVTARTAGTGFTISAVILSTGVTGILDTSVVSWMVVEP